MRNLEVVPVLAGLGQAGADGAHHGGAKKRFGRGDTAFNALDIRRPLVRGTRSKTLAVEDRTTTLHSLAIDGEGVVALEYQPLRCCTSVSGILFSGECLFAEKCCMRIQLCEPPYARCPLN